MANVCIGNNGKTKFLEINFIPSRQLYADSIQHFHIHLHNYTVQRNTQYADLRRNLLHLLLKDYGALLICPWSRPCHHESYRYDGQQ